MAISTIWLWSFSTSTRASIGRYNFFLSLFAAVAVVVIWRWKGNEVSMTMIYELSVKGDKDDPSTLSQTKAVAINAGPQDVEKDRLFERKSFQSTAQTVSYLQTPPKDGAGAVDANGSSKTTSPGLKVVNATTSPPSSDHEGASGDSGAGSPAPRSRDTSNSQSGTPPPPPSGNSNATELLQVDQCNEHWWIQDPFDLYHNLAGKCTARAKKHVIQCMSDTVALMQARRVHPPSKSLEALPWLNMDPLDDSYKYFFFNLLLFLHLQRNSEFVSAVSCS